MKTYQIKSEFYEIQQLLENEEFDEETGELIDNSETIKELLNEITDARNNKADSIAYLIKETRDTENAIKAEITRLNGRERSAIRQQKSLHQLLDYLLGGTKLKTDRFTFSYRKSSSVNVFNESLLKDEFITSKTTTTPNKKAIKNSINNGVEVAGCEFITKTSLGVR